MIHSSKFYVAQYKKYKQSYAKLHKTYGKNMAKRFTEAQFVENVKRGNIRITPVSKETAQKLHVSNASQLAQEAIYTTKGQGSNLNVRIKEGIRLARQKQAEGKPLTQLEQMLANTNIGDINVSDIRARRGVAGELLDAIESAENNEEAWKTAVGSI
jgi:hypothetical protein